MFIRLYACVSVCLHACMFVLAHVCACMRVCLHVFILFCIVFVDSIPVCSVCVLCISKE